MAIEMIHGAVRRHLEGFWADRVQEEFSWTLGPINERLPGFKVRRIAPGRRVEPWVYVTIGASTAREGGHSEFLLLAPDENPRHVETLAMVAAFHADESFRLSVGSTIDIGHPWLEGAVSDHLLVSLPYPFGPDFEYCRAFGHDVRFLWLVPITEAETGFIRSRGLEQFEQLLEASGLDVLSPDRQSIVM